MTKLLPGQQMINGVSSYIFGSNMPPDYAQNTVRNTPQMQALVKSAGLTVMRCAIPVSSADSYIDLTANACAAMGTAMLVILNHGNLAWNQHMVTYLGSRCNMYEFSNEPDLGGISWQQYLQLWNQHIPLMRAINAQAAYIGPVLGVYANVQSYLVPWLQGCKTSGVLPDGVSYHIYPCTGQSSQTVCATKAPNIGNTVPVMNGIVSGILGYQLPLCMTEWNIDANSPVQPYSLDPTFNATWTKAAIDSMAAQGMAMACQFDAGSGAASGGDDLISTQSFQPQVQYQPMVDSVRKYLGSGTSGGGATSLSVSPNSRSFSGTAGGSNPASQTVSITNGGSASINYTATSANSWLGVSPSSGTIAAGASATSTISISLTGLAAGTYNGSITITSGTITITVNVLLTVAAGGGGNNPLSLYAAAAAASTVGTANQLYTVSGTPATTWTYSRLGTATGYGEVTSHGTTSAWAGSGSIGSPTGNGFLFDSTSLEGQQIASGNWTANVRLNCAQNGNANPQQGTITADIIVRSYKRSSGGTYTLLATMTLTGQTINNNFTTYALPAASGTSVTLSTGDKIYVDIWLNVTANANGSTVQDIRLNRLSTDTSGHTGDPFTSVTSPGYTAAGGGGGAGITVGPGTLAFNTPVANPQAASQSLTVTNTGGSSGNWTASIVYSGVNANWLTISPTSGTLAGSASATVTVTDIPQGFSVGTYTATVIVSIGSSSASCTVTMTIGATGFITRSGATLYKSGSAWRASGANIYWLGLFDLNPAGGASIHYPSTIEIDDALATAAEMGAGVVRSLTLGASVGNSLSIWPALSAPNTQAFNVIDYAIYRAGVLGLRLIIPLVDNNATFAGGRSVFTTWRGLTDVTQFWINSQVIADFEAYIASILNRTNQYNGLLYKNDPTILAWETGNELSGAPITWTTTIANYIKSVDANHLVMDGSLGVNNSALSISAVDLYSNHLFPPSSSQISTDATATSGASKAYMIGAFDWTGAHGGTALSTFLTAIEGNSNIALDAFFHLQPHNVAYGYDLDSDGYSLYYPGTTAGMQTASQALRTHAYTMAGVSVPAAGAVAAPVFSSISQTGGGISIAWTGVAGGLNYDLEKSTAGSNGPYSLVTNLTDSQLPYTDNSGTTSTWYRVRAYNYADVAGPYSQPGFAGGNIGGTTPTTSTMLTTNGLNLLRDELAKLITYVALGTSNNVQQATDTQLGNEVFRKAVTSYTDGSTGQILINMYLAPGEATGTDIEEVGFFGGPTASATPNSGVLLAHGLWSHNPKAVTESIQFTLNFVL